MRYRYALLDSKNAVDRFSIMVMSLQPHFSSISEAARPVGPPPTITADFPFRITLDSVRDDLTSVLILDVSSMSRKTNNVAKMHTE